MYVKVYEYQIQESKTAAFLAYNRLSQTLYENTCLWKCFF